ncbi:hypothetical protein, partial [Enterococcus avium]|uniref:hypothetical protein n=1 Tax=Enterococcus avium TaxID=33945 RepID=UPI0028910899
KLCPLVSKANTFCISRSSNNHALNFGIIRRPPYFKTPVPLHFEHLTFLVLEIEPPPTFAKATNCLALPDPQHIGHGVKSICFDRSIPIIT